MPTRVKAFPQDSTRDVGGADTKDEAELDSCDSLIIGHRPVDELPPPSEVLHPVEQHREELLIVPAMDVNGAPAVEIKRLSTFLGRVPKRHGRREEVDEVLIIDLGHTRLMLGDEMR